jgi:peptidoglycan hydrolase-like protein with peptidoglycan-binding domain
MQTDIVTDGLFGPQTEDAIYAFQEAHEDETGTPWGGVGPDTSKALLYPDLTRIVKSYENPKITPAIVSGTIRHESNWDAGAVGYIDDRDVGLAQINAEAHPDWTVAERLSPLPCFEFVTEYYIYALGQLNGNIRDAIASYNLGVGGARTWIRAGRPDSWTPAGSTTPRDVKGYIDSILKG